MSFDHTIAAVAAILAAILLSIPVFGLAERLAALFVKDSRHPRRIRPRNRTIRAIPFAQLPDLMTPRAKATIGIAAAMTLAIAVVLAFYARQTGFALR